jgi:hypothetical protein
VLPVLWVVYATQDREIVPRILTPVAAALPQNARKRRPARRPIALFFAIFL